MRIIPEWNDECKIWKTFVYGQFHVDTSIFWEFKMRNESSIFRGTLSISLNPTANVTIPRCNVDYQMLANASHFLATGLTVHCQWMGRLLIWASSHQLGPDCSAQFAPEASELHQPSTWDHYNAPQTWRGSDDRGKWRLYMERRRCQSHSRTCTHIPLWTQTKEEYEHMPVTMTGVHCTNLQVYMSLWIE